jgi:hypothetical protein
MPDCFDIFRDLAPLTMSAGDCAKTDFFFKKFLKMFIACPVHRTKIAYHQDSKASRDGEFPLSLRSRVSPWAAISFVY